MAILSVIIFRTTDGHLFTCHLPSQLPNAAYSLFVTIGRTRSLERARVKEYPTEWTTPGSPDLVWGGMACFSPSAQSCPLSHKHLGERGPEGVGHWLLLLLGNVFLLFSGKSPSSDENKLKSQQRVQ